MNCQKIIYVKARSIYKGQLAL